MKTRKFNLSDYEKELEELKQKLKAQDEKIILQENMIITLRDEIQSQRLTKRIERLFQPIILPVSYVKSSIRTFSLNAEEKALIKKLKNKPIYSPDERPLVSLIILNRNGIRNLRKFFDAVHKNTIYNKYEIIVADNASDDKSVDFLASLHLENLTVIENSSNLSFSEGNNKAAKQAFGSILVFLNNDVIPMYGWLSELLRVYHLQDINKIGALGSLLLYPGNVDISVSLHIQHAGIDFKKEADFLRPVNMDSGVKFKNKKYSEIENRLALTGAALMISKDNFDDVGGFDERYQYGYEDVDLCLKLIKRGKQNLLVSNSILYHDESWTQKKTSKYHLDTRRADNKKIFWSTWKTYLNKLIS